MRLEWFDLRATGAEVRAADAVGGVTDRDDHATAAVQRSTDSDARISDPVGRSIDAVQGTMDRDELVTRADGLRTDAEDRMADL